MANEKAPYKRDWRESTESAAKKGDSEAIAEMKEQAAKERKKLEEKDRFGAKASAYGADIIETLAKPAGRDTSNINKLKGEINMLKSNVKKYEDQGYAKGGDVQSESSKLDQKNAEMDKAQEEGYKRYQKQEADEARENAESRNIGKRLKDTALKAVDTVVTPIANKVHDANEYLSKKSEGVLSQKQREAMFGNPSKDREDWKKSSEKMTKDSYKKGGKVSSASSRGDGIATKGKTRGRIV